MIKSSGLSITQWENLMEMEITDEMWHGFDPMFKKFQRQDLGVLRFAFAAEKRF